MDPSPFGSPGNAETIITQREQDQIDMKAVVRSLKQTPPEVKHAFAETGFAKGKGRFSNVTQSSTTIQDWCVLHPIGRIWVGIMTPKGGTLKNRTPVLRPHVVEWSGPAWERICYKVQATMDVAIGVLVYHLMPEMFGHIGLLVDIGAVQYSIERWFVEKAAEHTQNFVDQDVKPRGFL